MLFRSAEPGTGAGFARTSRRSARFGRFRIGQREQVMAWLMAAPALLALFSFVLLPLILGAGWSVTDKRLISPLPTQVIGLDNYTTLLGVDLLVQDAVRDPATGTVVLDADGLTTYPRLRDILRGEARYKGYAEWFHVDLLDRRYVAIAKDPTFLHALDRKSTRLNSSHVALSRMPSSA